MGELVIQIDEKNTVSKNQQDIVAHQLPPEHVPIERIPYGDTTTDEDDEEEIMAWEEKDLENPYNWPGLRKRGVVLTTMMLIVNSTMGSALPSNALPFIAAEWGVESEQQMVLPISVYLIG